MKVAEYAALNAEKHSYLVKTALSEGVIELILYRAA